jgi:dTDP-4-amino-4,6-dideoxygalactose transaminase
VPGCVGDGGGLTVRDDELARKIRLLRDHGRNDDGLVVTWGMNSRLDNLHAAILNTKFDRFEDEIVRRREIARRHRAGLDDMEDLMLPPGPEGDPDGLRDQLPASARGAFAQSFSAEGPVPAAR